MLVYQHRDPRLAIDRMTKEDGSLYSPEEQKLLWGLLLDPSGGTKPDEQPKVIYTGPNYRAMANSAKKNAERQTPLLQKNYQSSIADINANKDFQEQQAEAARNLAKQDWLISNANTKRLNDAEWFIGEQKFNNLRSLMNNSMNNQYGSIRDSANKLMAKTRDIRDQQMYATLNSNLLGNQTEYAGKVNTINQGLDQDRMNTYQQLSDLLRQAGSNLTDYAGQLLSTLTGYYDYSVADKNGNITDWNWLNKNTGLKADENGAYALDLGWLLGDQMSEDEFNTMLEQLKSSHTPLMSIDQLALTRSAEDTRNYVRGQAGRNRNEAQKASNQAANQSYSVQQQRRGY